METLVRELKEELDAVEMEMKWFKSCKGLIPDHLYIEMELDIVNKQKELKMKLLLLRGNEDGEV
jgi:hypothetical protein